MVFISAAASARLLFGQRPTVTVVSVEAPNAQAMATAAGSGLRPGSTSRAPHRRVRITPWERGRAAAGLVVLTAALAAAVSVTLGVVVFAGGLVLQHAL